MERNYSIPTIIALLAIIQAAMCTTNHTGVPDVKDFFADKIKGNLTKITWAHAVNSKALLEDALKTDKIMMLEADVILGTTVNASADPFPIMGHPPANESDLSLEEFLEKVIADGKHGIKLDFKSIEAFDEGRTMLEKHEGKLNFPVWLNADILPGPVSADAVPVDAQKFITGAFASLPRSTLSIGWTTKYGSEFNITKGSYTKDHVQKMIDAIAQSKTNQPITYPVRAGLAANDITVFSDLLKKTSSNKPTLTIWSSENDVVNVAALSKLIMQIGVDQVYIDVPADLRAKIDLSSSAESVIVSSFMIVGSVIASLAITKLV